MSMGGWYAAHGLYVPEELGGLSVTRFAQAVSAEGCPCTPGVNKPLHLHPLFNNADIYGDQRPTRNAFTDRDVRQPEGSLPVSEKIMSHTYSVPWFKKFVPQLIEEYAGAFRKVALNHEALLSGDPGDGPALGGWHFFAHR